jgi:hypothetical protein
MNDIPICGDNMAGLFVYAPVERHLDGFKFLVVIGIGNFLV